MRTATRPILHLLHRVVEDQRLKALPDEELLRRFSTKRDEAAFSAILRRHGSMVLDICRNMLRNEADAEDAFQATFLVLARKAGAIRQKSSLGSWLHGVAYRLALKAQAALARRQKHEARASCRPTALPSNDLAWREVQQILHLECKRPVPGRLASSGTMAVFPATKATRKPPPCIAALAATSSRSRFGVT